MRSGGTRPAAMLFDWHGTPVDTLTAGAKANHLAHLGDATVGERVNYGADSITANSVNWRWAARAMSA